VAGRTGDRMTIDGYFVPAIGKLESNRAYLEHLSIASRDSSLIRLASNENLEPPAPEVRVAVQRAVASANVYPSPSPPLQASLAERHRLGRSSVLLGAGAAEVIDAVIRAFVSRGDEVILPSPTWPVYRKRLLALEAAIAEVPLQRDGTGYRYEVAGIMSLLTARTKLIVICSPNNPTGNLLPRAQLETVAGSGCPVLVDSAYDDFALGADRLDEAAAGRLVSEFGNVLVARTFSKAYALAGLRLGYLLGRPEVIERVERMMLPGGCVSNVALAAGEAALEAAGYHDGHVARLVSERRRVIDGLRAAGLDALDSLGNFVPVEVGSVPGKSAWFARQMLDSKIVVRAMSESLVRITVGRPHENDAVLEAADALGLASRQAPSGPYAQQARLENPVVLPK
jgi:histidinol-phosphate aminotransferase